jgi:hypothetical protein
MRESLLGSTIHSLTSSGSLAYPSVLTSTTNATTLARYASYRLPCETFQYAESVRELMRAPFSGFDPRTPMCPTYGESAIVRFERVFAVVDDTSKRVFSAFDDLTRDSDDPSLSALVERVTRDFALLTSAYIERTSSAIAVTGQPTSARPEWKEDADAEACEQPVRLATDVTVLVALRREVYLFHTQFMTLVPKILRMMNVTGAQFDASKIRLETFVELDPLETPMDYVLTFYLFGLTTYTKPLEVATPSASNRENKEALLGVLELFNQLSYTYRARVKMLLEPSSKPTNGVARLFRNSLPRWE